MLVQSAYLIDDDPIYHVIVQKWIKKTQIAAQVQCFPDGSDAFQSLRRHIRNSRKLPELILLDLNMPHMDGWEFLDALDSLKRRLVRIPRVIIVTSSPLREDRERALQYPIVLDYILKPFDVSHFLQIRTKVARSLGCPT